MNRRFLEYCIQLFLALVLVAACARHIREENHTIPDAAFDMVVASDSSDFKDAVRSKLINGFKDRANIRVVTIDQLRQIDPADDDIVVIIDTCMAWGGFNTATKHFLDRLKTPQQVVLMMTAGNPEWHYRYRDVDAITSASLIDNIPGVVHRLNARINEILRSRIK
jgi:hypothetical protein